MRVAVHAVGRMKSGPEKELADRFFDRFGKSGAPLGLDFAGVTEISESRAATASERRREEAMRLSAALPAGAALVLLDERGRELGSEAFARFLAEQRDGGRRATWLAIGGPDGHDRDAAPKADLVLLLRQGHLAAPAGAGHAGRAALPGGDDSRRPSLSPGLSRRTCHGAAADG